MVVSAFKVWERSIKHEVLIITLNMEIPNKKELYIGLGALSFGFLYYFLFRDTYFTEQLVFIKVNDNAPSFFHTFAFALISSAFCSVNDKNKAIFSWVLINAVFETAQLWSLEDKSGFFSNFVNGSFDAGDVLASMGGGLCAWLVIRFI